MTPVQWNGINPIAPNRSLTAAQPAAAPPAGPGIQADVLATQSLPKDPAMMANLAIMSLDLASGDPAKVQAALVALDGTFGPAYRQEVLGAIAGQLRPGMPPESAKLLGSYLSQAQATGALPQMMAVMQADPALAAALGPSAQNLQSQVRGSGAAPSVAPLGAPMAAANSPVGNSPLFTPNANPAAAPVSPAQAAGLSSAQIEALAAKLADYKQSSTAAVEIARLSPEQALAVMQVAFANPNIVATMNHDKGMAVVAKAFATKVPNPAALEIMRGVLALPKAGNGGPLDEARTRAAVALLHHGNPERDLPGVMRLMMGDHPVMPKHKSLLLKTLASRPAFVDHPVAVRALAAMASDETIYDVALGANYALSRSKHPWAKEALGTSLLLRDPEQPARRKLFTLQYLKTTTGPLPASVKRVLEELAKHKDEQVAKLAKELLRRC